MATVIGARTMMLGRQHKTREGDEFIKNGWNERNGAWYEAYWSFTRPSKHVDTTLILLILFLIYNSIRAWIMVAHTAIRVCEWNFKMMAVWMSNSGSFNILSTVKEYCEWYTIFRLIYNIYVMCGETCMAVTMYYVILFVLILLLLYTIRVCDGYARTMIVMTVMTAKLYMGMVLLCVYRLLLEFWDSLMSELINNAVILAHFDETAVWMAESGSYMILFIMYVIYQWHAVFITYWKFVMDNMMDTVIQLQCKIMKRMNNVVTNKCDGYDDPVTSNVVCNKSDGQGDPVTSNVVCNKSDGQGDPITSNVVINKCDVYDDPVTIDLVCNECDGHGDPVTNNVVNNKYDGQGDPVESNLVRNNCDGYGNPVASNLVCNKCDGCDNPVTINLVSNKCDGYAVYYPLSLVYDGHGIFSIYLSILVAIITILSTMCICAYNVCDSTAVGFIGFILVVIGTLYQLGSIIIRQLRAATILSLMYVSYVYGIVILYVCKKMKSELNFNAIILAQCNQTAVWMGESGSYVVIFILCVTNEWHTVFVMIGESCVTVECGRQAAFNILITIQNCLLLIVYSINVMDMAILSQCKIYVMIIMDMIVQLQNKQGICMRHMSRYIMVNHKCDGQGDPRINNVYLANVADGGHSHNQYNVYCM